MTTQVSARTATGAAAAFPRWLVVALALAAALVAGAAAAWLALRPPAETSAEVVFARDMTNHHEQAVAMATVLYDRSESAELRQFALDIMLTQQAQIGQMQGWLAAWDRPLHSTRLPMDGQGLMMGMATPEQMDALHTLPLPALDVSFLQLMIRHHQGGVIMAQQALTHTQRREVVRLASAMAQAQQGEIDYMEQLLTERGAASPEPVMPMDMDHSGQP